MIVNDINTSQLTAIIGNLAELHEWELEFCPLLTSLTGRNLYYRIAQRTIANQAPLSKALKVLTGGSGYTEKALRNRIQEMEKAGYIVTVGSEQDGRSKCIMPTEKFYEVIYWHTNQVQHIFEKDFLMIQK